MNMGIRTSGARANTDESSLRGETIADLPES